MKNVLYGLLLVSLLFAPVNGRELANLEPVEGLAVYKEGEQIVLLTDTQAMGKGSTLEQAMAQLLQSRPRVVYLDTARYLFIGTNGADCGQQLRNMLKAPEALPYAGGDVKTACDYADIRKDVKQKR